MKEAVQPVYGIRIMPVIKVKIMQHSPSYHTFITKAYWQQESQAIAVIGHNKTMGECCGIAMLDELFHLQKLFLLHKLMKASDEFLFLCRGDGLHRLSF